MPGPLLEVSLLFSKLGIMSFGGPAAHIALMESEVVQKRRWLSREHFLDFLAVTNLIPGPNATEMAIHIGYVRAGWPGLVAGGVGFILPAALITLALAWLYVHYGALPQGQAIFYGINPIIVAIVLSATYRLGRAAIKSVPLGILALACLVVSLLAVVDQAVVLLAAGAVGLILQFGPRIFSGHGSQRGGAGPLAALVGVAGPLVVPAWAGSKLVGLGLFFLKVGALLFGSGMVLFAFVQHDVVSSFGWLTQRQLVDAIAVGQMTPGPVLSSATFIGYLVAGLPGALIATGAVFLPSFVITAAISPWVRRLRHNSYAQAFLSGVNAAVVAAILSVALTLIRSAVVDVPTAVLVLVGLVLLVRYRVETWQLVLGGAMVGVLRLLMIS